MPCVLNLFYKVSQLKYFFGRRIDPQRKLFQHIVVMSLNFNTEKKSFLTDIKILESCIVVAIIQYRLNI